jgi:hypothetical protein
MFLIARVAHRAFAHQLAKDREHRRPTFFKLAMIKSAAA